MSRLLELFEHTQRYTREVFAERLRAEGFVSYKGEDIHWYRLVNGEVVQAIYFVTRHTALNAIFEIYYGCHPLYIPPVLQKSPYMYALAGYEQMNDRVPETVPGSTINGFQNLVIHGLQNRPYRVPDAMILCPTDKNRGLDILELVFPVMDDIITPSACYKMHKDRRKNEMKNKFLGNFFAYFVDEVLFWEDRALYELCRAELKRKMLNRAQFQKDGIKVFKSYQIELEQCVRLDEVFRTGCRQEYLQTFPDREQETLRLLRKYCGIGND